jgi:hypothetical protein
MPANPIRRTVRLIGVPTDIHDMTATVAAPGSHRLGRVPAKDAAGHAQRLGHEACLAETGDVWLYATPILHASERARIPAQRRVVQVDYATISLPGGLKWLGLVQ